MVEARISDIEIHGLTPPRLEEEGRERRPEGIFEGTHEQDHQALDHHDHVAVDLRLGEGEFRAALVEQAEQHGGQHDAHRMGAAHERHGDADEARAADEIQHQAVLHAEDLVHRHQPGQRAGDRHGDDDDAARLDAGIDGGIGIGAHRADLVAELGAPQQVPDGDGGDDGEEDREVERRGGEPHVEELARHLARAHDVGAGDLAALHRHLAHRAEPVVDEIAHQARGDEVEHDGGDDDVAAALGLQEPGIQAQKAPTAMDGENGQRNDDGPGQELEPQPHRGGAEPAI